MVRAAGLLMILSFLLGTPLTASASELVYTIQTGSFPGAAEAKKQFDSIVAKSGGEGIDYLRIEKVGDYHSVRIGKFQNLAAADAYLAGGALESEKPLILKAYIKDERIEEMYGGASEAKEETLTNISSPEKSGPSASELIYTIQTGSFQGIEDAKKQFDSIVQGSNGKVPDYLRIEKVGSYHSVRIGKFDDQASAAAYLGERDLQISNPLIMTAYIKDERIEEMYARASGAEEETLITAPLHEKNGPSEREKPETNISSPYYASISPAVYDDAVQDKVQTDSGQKMDIPADDDKSVNTIESGESNVHAEASISADKISANKEVQAESASESVEVVKTVNPINDATVEQHAAVTEMAEENVPADYPSETGAAAETSIPDLTAAAEQYAAKEDKGSDAMDEHDLLEELGLDHVEQSQAVKYHFAEIKPYTELAMGYRFGGSDGLDRALEFEDLKSFPMFHGDYEAFHYPHKYHVDITANTDNDYLADLRYGYKSDVNARLFNTTFLHNLDDIDLIDLDATVASPGVTINDDDDKFWLRNGITHTLFKYKHPGYHGHAYYEGLFVTKKGSQQQRSLAGSGYFNNLQRLSRNRNIDQLTAQNTVGINGHLGAAEFDLSHKEKSFKTKKEDVLYDDYTATVSRPAGNFPHNQIPELKSSSNSLKIHTGYTGKLVAAATFSMKEKRNETSGASEDVFVGEGSIRWMPLLRLSLFLNYAHRNIEADNQSTTSITSSSGVTTTYSTAVKPSVSSSSDYVSITARYRPEKMLTLKARYTFEHISRDDVGLWNLKDSTRKNGLSLSADAKIMKGMKLKLDYSLRSVDKPSYNTESYYNNRGMASISWVPVSRVSLLLSYSVERAERNELGFSETDSAKDRDVKTDNVFGSGTFQLLDNLSLSASYAYMRYEVKQDIVYEDLGSTETSESGIPFTDSAHVYSVFLNYRPLNGLDLTGRITHTRTDGEFEPKSLNLTSPINIASFSRHKMRKTVYHASGNYACLNKFTCSLDLQYGDVDDGLDNVYDNVEDGSAYIILFRVIRKWG